MTDEDAQWAHAFLLSQDAVEECTAGRTIIGGITHRALLTRFVPGSVNSTSGWCTLCGRRPASTRLPWTPELLEPSVDRPVDCMACIAAGG